MDDFIKLVKKILIVLLALWVAFIIFRIIVVGVSVAVAMVWALSPIWITLIIVYIVLTVVGKKKK
ncbi:MAG: hypothetical protein IKO30_11395 [Lachnospiraceae bacterium]|nr:hypothetical protein [Lachnospiraceae bacterium]